MIDKLITLCWQCRVLLSGHYKVISYSSKETKKSCENCGNKYNLSLCRVTTKGDDE